MKKLLLVILSVLAFAIPAWATVVDLNTATVTQLESVKGIGPKKAQYIMDYRKKTPFKSVDDLTKVKGFGKKTVDKMRKELKVGPPPKPVLVKAAPVKKVPVKPVAVKPKTTTTTVKPAAKTTGSTTVK
ncbi:MAG TPA: helix-hairpin-helix domain-containing protein [Methylophilaceae bacterium]